MRLLNRMFVTGAAAVAAMAMAQAANASIADIYTGGAGSYTETATVTGILDVYSPNNTFVLQDATGGVLAFRVPEATYTATLGDTINFTATNSPYNGAPELVATGFTVNSVTAGTAPAPTVLTIPQFNTAGDGTANALAPYAQTIVELDGVSISGAPATLATYTNYTLTDSSANTADMYTTGSDSAVSDAIDAANAANPGGFGGTFNIVGYVDVYKGEAEIYPMSITAVPEPASLSLLAIGAVGCLWRRRRR